MTLQDSIFIKGAQSRMGLQNIYAGVDPIQIAETQIENFQNRIKQLHEIKDILKDKEISEANRKIFYDLIYSI